MTPERFARIRDRLARRQPDLTVLAENVHKAHNIAAIQRTADAVGLFRIHAVSETGEFRHHHMISGGARRWVRVQLHGSTKAAANHLKQEGFGLVAADLAPDARDYRKIDYTRKIAILMGSELTGVSNDARHLVDDYVSIPMEGMGRSLNVSVATALILYEARRQREAAGMYERNRLSTDVYERTLFEWAHPEMARRCREEKLPYPALTEDGDLAENPFVAARGD